MPKGTDLLRRALKQSGLSQVAFAKQYLSHSPRTVKRWLAGGAIPAGAQAQIRRALDELRGPRGSSRA